MALNRIAVEKPTKVTKVKLTIVSNIANEFNASVEIVTTNNVGEFVKTIGIGNFEQHLTDAQKLAINKLFENIRSRASNEILPI